jgi:hypothetical protein
MRCTELHIDRIPERIRDRGRPAGNVGLRERSDAKSRGTRKDSRCSEEKSLVHTDPPTFRKDATGGDDVANKGFVHYV